MFWLQIQDDYLDCYGEPEVIGKIGTDIQVGSHLQWDAVCHTDMYNKCIWRGIYLEISTAIMHDWTNILSRKLSAKYRQDVSYCLPCCLNAGDDLHFPCIFHGLALVQDNKCSWLVVQALERASESQKATIEVGSGNSRHHTVTETMSERPLSEIIHRQRHARMALFHHWPSDLTLTQNSLKGISFSRAGDATIYSEVVYPNHDDIAQTCSPPDGCILIVCHCCSITMGGMTRMQ